MTRTCCYIDDDGDDGVECESDAEWSIHWEGVYPAPDNYADACSEHLGEMIPDEANEFTGYRLTDEGG